MGNKTLRETKYVLYDGEHVLTFFLTDIATRDNYLIVRLSIRRV